MKYTETRKMLTAMDKFLSEQENKELRSLSVSDLSKIRECIMILRRLVY